MVLLIGNYALDQQQSMDRFAAMMLQGLRAAGIDAEIVTPRSVFGKFRGAGHFIAKWLAYIDKFFLFRAQLRKRLAQGPRLAHICDHSNAMYARWIERVPVVVTCHDLLAVRGALGEQTDCPASFTGRFLQRWILRGLRAASAVVCVSRATLDDARRLLARDSTAPHLDLVPLGLNYPYRKISGEEARSCLGGIAGLDRDTPFVLHVGSNLRRKNREGVLRIFARCRDRWNGRLIFAGDAPSPELRSLAVELQIADRIIAIEKPSSELLEALYNRAIALVYPSRFEGFGWPIIEAQACGCPVICSDTGPLPEVAGEGALIHAVDEEEKFADDIIGLTNPAEREMWSAKSSANAQRFSTQRMVERYIEIYRTLASQL